MHSMTHPAVLVMRLWAQSQRTCMGGCNIRSSDSLACRDIRDTEEPLPLLNPSGFMRSDTHGIGGVVLL